MRNSANKKPNAHALLAYIFHLSSW